MKQIQIPGPRDEAWMGEKLKEFHPSIGTRLKALITPGIPFVRRAVILVDVLFTDVSFWQRIIDFAKMKLAGAMGVIIRAGQNAWVDAFWMENWRKAKETGLPRGSYWFFDSRYDPKLQARLWASLIKADSGEMEHVLDLEENYGGPYAGWRNWYDCLTEFQRWSGLPDDRIAIYTGYYYWLENGPSPMVEQESLTWFGRYSLWLAYWTDYPANVRIPAPWTNCRHWQKGPVAEGEKYGVQTAEIDINYANMTQAEFAAKYGGGAVPEPPPDGGAMNGTAKEILGKTGTVRSSPAVVSGNDTGKRIAPYSTIEFVRVVDGSAVPTDKWFELPDGNYLNYILAGRAYYQIMTQPSEPEPSPNLPDLPVSITLGDDVTYARQTVNVILKPK